MQPKIHIFSVNVKTGQVHVSGEVNLEKQAHVSGEVKLFLTQRSEEFQKGRGRVHWVLGGERGESERRSAYMSHLYTLQPNRAQWAMRGHCEGLLSNRETALQRYVSERVW